MKLAPGLHTHADVSGVDGVRLLKVLCAEEADYGRYAPENILIWNGASRGYAGFIGADAEDRANGIRVTNVRHPDVIQPGDIVRLRQDGSLVSVLYRRGSPANSLFVTEQCNSLCLMCSQPPRDDDDRWRLGELHSLIDLVDLDEEQLGVTGGEPTLLREDLAALLSHARRKLPDTHLHVLTNGRLFGDEALVDLLTSAAGDQTTWAIPLYGDNAATHDEIVASPNAFDETLSGLFQLARRKARVEIRIVLHAMSVPRLPQLASYIYRRMPFVEHVTFMGLEPMGFAKMNRARLWIDPVDYQRPLADAVHHLASRGMNVSIYNLPLCVLDPQIRPYARASISDWKNRDIPECRSCSVRERCAGFFASAGPTWRSRAVAPINDVLHSESSGG